MPEALNTTLAVFGGSGAVGLLLIRHALQKGIQVRTLLRKEHTVLRQSDGLEVVIGSLQSAQNVGACVQGSSAVLCIFGPRPPYADIFCAQATETILGAMAESRILRLVCLTGAMIGSYPQNRTRPFRWMVSLFNRRLPEIANDRTAQEDAVKRSGLSWTIVKPTRLTDKPGTGSCIAGPDVRVGMLSSITRFDLAGFLLDEALSPRFDGRAVFIKNG